MTYAEKLRDPRWQKKRLEIMGRDKFTCQKCSDATKTLNVHHRYYSKGAMPWEYPDNALVTLCEPCHRIIEARVEFINREIHGRDYRQESFFRMLNAVKGEGPHSYPGCGFIVDSVGEFLEIYEHTICYDGGSDEEAREWVELLESHVYQVMRGLMGCIDEANRISREKLLSIQVIAKDEPLIELPPLINKPCADEGFWASFLAQVNERRPLTLHWVMAGTLLDIAESVVTLGFPESEEIAMEALMRDTTRAFLEGAAESILGRKVTFEMVIDSAEVCK